jgi:hypothetical protein
MVVIEKNYVDNKFCGVIRGPTVTYTCNCLEDDAFEIDEETFEAKILLIEQGLPFENASLEVELPDYMWLDLAMEAHEKDMKLNDYIEYILRLAIDNS